MADSFSGWPDSSSWEMTPHFAWGREIAHGALIGLAVVAVLLLSQRFDADFELIDDDAISSWQPIFTDFARQLGEGHMPVWSHHTSCGYPLLGWPQPSFVYPPMWIAHGFCRLIGVESGEFYVATLMHSFLAAVASFVYLRRFGVHPLAATTASLAATLSGILLGLGACWPTYIFTFVYWPMIFLTLEELRGGERVWFWTIFLGLLGGLAFLYTDLLLMIKLTMLAGLYFVLRIHPPTLRQNVRSLAIASVIALLIGLGQLVPSSEIIVTSERMGMGSNDFYKAPPLLWLGLIYPFWTLPWEEFAFSRARAAGGFFVGPCAVLGALFAVRLYRPLRGPHRALLILSGVYLSLALGSLWYPNEFLQKLPILSAIRWPFRWLFEASCLLALLSGFGLHLAFRELTRQRGYSLVLVFIATAGCALMMNWPAPEGMALRKSIMFAVWVIGLVAVWTTARAGRATHFLAVICGWTGLAMIANIPVAQQTRMARMTHLLDEPLIVGQGTQERILFLARHSELVAAQKEGNLARSFPHRFDTRSVLGYVYRPPTQAWMSGFELDGLLYEKEDDIARRFLIPQSTILSTLRVGYIVVFKRNMVLDDACADNPNFKLERETEFYRIYRNDGFRRPAFLVRQLQMEKERNDLVEMGLRTNMPDVALVEPGYSGPLRFSGEGNVTDFHEHHGQISFNVAVADDAFVVVTTTLFPRWRAIVDGAETPLVRVNGSFMGLRVPAGEHVVRLEYRPTDHLVFLAISGLTLVLTIGCLWRLASRAA